mmetsp:Transcript_53045/g.84580  ORF Transcript_53045/g.84580 Transcript_53045/m.84580 type:complete len:313 (+) Transcript_53045:546-1484(+)
MRHHKRRVRILFVILDSHDLVIESKMRRKCAVQFLRLRLVRLLEKRLGNPLKLAFAASSPQFFGFLAHTTSAASFPSLRSPLLGLFLLLRFLFIHRIDGFQRIRPHNHRRLERHTLALHDLRFFDIRQLRFWRHRRHNVLLQFAVVIAFGLRFEYIVNDMHHTAFGRQGDIADFNRVERKRQFLADPHLQRRLPAFPRSNAFLLLGAQRRFVAFSHNLLLLLVGEAILSVHRTIRTDTFDAGAIGTGTEKSGHRQCVKLDARHRFVGHGHVQVFVADLHLQIILNDATVGGDLVDNVVDEHRNHLQTRKRDG